MRPRGTFARVQPFGERKPEIAYPCPWSYRILGSDETRMREAVRAIVGAAQYDLKLSNESRGGKYRSLELELVVADETQRLSIFEALRVHADVRFVF